METKTIDDLIKLKGLLQESMNFFIHTTAAWFEMQSWIDMQVSLLENVEDRSGDSYRLEVLKVIQKRMNEGWVNE